MDDAQSAVLLVAPSFNASLIGAGPTGAPLQPLFGNIDFKAYNIDFQNRAVSNNIRVAPLSLSPKRSCHSILITLPYDMIIHLPAVTHTGKLCNIASPSDRHLLRERVVLWLYFRKLSRHLVHRPKCKHIRRGQYHFWPDRL